MESRYMFRGKRLEDSEWVIGNFMMSEPKPFTKKSYPVIIEKESGFAEYIEPSTLGQCTGLKDKNGELIFEGEILQDEHGVGEVIWLQEHCAFVVRNIEPHEYHFPDSGSGQLVNTEIIGNVHDDSPELLFADKSGIEYADMPVLESAT